MRFSDMHFLSLVLLGLLPALSNAAKVIYASSVEFCGENQLILLEKANFRFYPDNHTVDFSIIANSIANNVDATINLNLIAYGLEPVNVSIDLCNLAGGTLCPLPVYNFNGSATYILPNDITDQIPSIAYYLPDLEARARLSIIDQATGLEAACLTAYLSNGLTANHNYVSWAVGGVIIIAYIICLINSIWPISAVFSGPDYRLFTAVSWLQHIVITGTISVEYPAVFQAFTRNFSWAFGLIYIQPVEDNVLRKALSSGGLNDPKEDAISLTNAINALTNGINNAVGNAQVASGGSGAYTLEDVQGSTADSARAGVEQFAERIGLSPATLFITSLIVFLILAAIMLVLVVLFGGIAMLVAFQQKKKRGSSFVTLTRKHWIDFAALNALRWVMVIFCPLVLLAAFTFHYEGTVGWAFVTVAAVTFTLLLITMFGIFGLLLFGRKRRDNTEEIYSGKLQRRMTPLFEQYKHKWWFTSGPLFFALFVQAVFVGAGQRHPLVQLIPLIVIEAFILIFLIAVRPYQSKGSNALTIILSIARLVIYGLLITFLQRLNVNRIAVTVIGIVILVIQSVLFLVIVAVMLKQLILGIKWAVKSKKDRRRSSMFATKEDDANPDYLEEKKAPIRDPTSPQMAEAGQDQPHVAPHAWRGSAATLVDSRSSSQRNSKTFPVPSRLSDPDRQSGMDQTIPEDNSIQPGYTQTGVPSQPRFQSYASSDSRPSSVVLSNAYANNSRPTSTILH